MEIIKIFERVRDIPYKIPLSYGEEDNCCSGKSDRLFDLLTKEGFKVRHRVCLFLWDALPLPKEVRKVSHDKDCTHTFLEIYLNGKWKILDATWDIGLKDIFEVNIWDGKSNTKIAVEPVKIFSPEKSLSIVEDQTREVIDDDLSRNKKFYKKFNEWLKEIRNGNL